MSTATYKQIPKEIKAKHKIRYLRKKKRKKKTKINCSSICEHGGSVIGE